MRIFLGVTVTGVVVFRVEIPHHGVVPTHRARRAAKACIHLAHSPIIEAQIDHLKVIVLTYGESKFLRVKIRSILGLDKHATKVALLRGVEQQDGREMCIDVLLAQMIGHLGKVTTEIGFSAVERPLVLKRLGIASA